MLRLLWRKGSRCEVTATILWPLAINTWHWPEGLIIRAVLSPDVLFIGVKPAFLTLICSALSLTPTVLWPWYMYCFLYRFHWLQTLIRSCTCKLVCLLYDQRQVPNFQSLVLQISNMSFPMSVFTISSFNSPLHTMLLYRSTTQMDDRWMDNGDDNDDGIYTAVS